MKTKNLVLAVSLLLAVSLGLSAWLLRPQTAAYAQIWSEGELLYTLDLRVDRVVQVQTAAGSNRIEVRQGKIAVTQADCPDGYCVDRGFCSGGVRIICLPHRLTIRFLKELEMDCNTPLKLMLNFSVWKVIVSPSIFQVVPFQILS